MKKMIDSFKKSFAWILAAIFITAILDLWGLTRIGEKQIGYGFILGILLFVGFIIYDRLKKPEK